MGSVKPASSNIIMCVVGGWFWRLGWDLCLQPLGKCHVVRGTSSVWRVDTCCFAEREELLEGGVICSHALDGMRVAHATVWSFGVQRQPFFLVFFFVEDHFFLACGKFYFLSILLINQSMLGIEEFKQRHFVFHLDWLNYVCFCLYCEFSFCRLTELKIKVWRVLMFHG